MSDDDLTPFRDDPVLLALRAPAQAHELAGEDAALAMFRQSLPARRRRRRALTRAGVGGAGLLLGLGLTGGVAAAYTTGLPDPVQDVVHAAIDPLPVPAPPTAQVLRVRDRAAAALRNRMRERAAERAKQQAALPTAQPTGAPRAVAPPGPAAPRSAQASPQPSPQPSPTAAPPPPTWTVAVSRRLVPVHGQVVLSGRLTRGGGDPLPGRVVYAAELPAGTSTWRRVANGRTAADGTIALTVPALTTNVRLRLVTAQGVTSRQLVVSVVPKLTTTWARSGNHRVVTVTADGGSPGNAVKLFRRDGSAWTQLATSTLGSEGRAQFDVALPAATPVRYLVRLPATARHAAALVEFVVPARSA
ncbi:MAG: hypothetical protein QOE05_3346 [Actinomycetota bacterium]|jgi:hypothetical protein|nr:hypothetical protein [Actinomycetota bacterium]